jgi:arylsulfatase A-like enzyme
MVVYGEVGHVLLQGSNAGETGECIARTEIFWHFPNYIGGGHRDNARPCSVIRQGDWKLIESLEDGALQLFNLKEDMCETTDLASRMPEKAAELRRRLEAHRKEARVQWPRKKKPL